MGTVDLRKFKFHVVRSQEARRLIIRKRPGLGPIKPKARLRVHRSSEVPGLASVKLRSNIETLVPALSCFLRFLFISFERDA
jgi:hypothetical protein